MRILLISAHHPDARYLMKALLEASHSVEELDDVRDGVFAATEEAFDVIVLLADTPTDSKRLQDDVAVLRGVARDVVLLAVSDRLRPEDRTALLKLGADAGFERPVSFLEFNERMKRLLRMRSPRLFSRLSALDAETLTYAHDACRCKLTRHEYLMMECLLRAGEAAVPRDVLVRYVWPGKDDVNPSNLNLLASRLRSKIQSLGMRVRLVAVPSVGYSLVESAE
ncbi:response regulator transcription factor [Pararobbsia silviterrae]|uniref:DNA-binding response regulator n=1 Tax=Pararobbsia silviterrae TaxID=1792498 RepID=A0A494XQC4_9BURK|nr:winged helix-turn-helix domain-containing protein [Pararobbsia silviterrae]RKP49723.1 DNA-binding response regulator [Pararobbsia silviterrae]